MDITELRRNQTIKRHPWEIIRAKIIRFFIKKYHPSCSHILDFGSGDAFVLKYLCHTKTGSQYSAIDTAYTKEIIEHIDTNKNCKINFLHQLPEILKPRANCVLLLDVLEHCENDMDILPQLNNDSLTESPVFFITVPAFQQLFSGHDKLLHHYRRYSIHRLKEICKKNNYKIISSGYFFSSLLFVRSLQLLFEKISLRSPAKSIDNWNGSVVLSAFISFILWVDFITGRFFSLVGIPLPGLSAYCICQPSPL